MAGATWRSDGTSLPDCFDLIFYLRAGQGTKLYQDIALTVAGFVIESSRSGWHRKRHLKVEVFRGRRSTRSSQRDDEPKCSSTVG